MSLKILAKKSIHYYRRKGFLGTLRHIPRKLRWTIFRKRDILYVCDLVNLNGEGVSLPQEVTIEKKQTLQQLTGDEIQALCGEQDESVFTEQLKSRFSRGSAVWLIKHQGKTAGMFWTITGTTIEPHYVCITPFDAHLYNGKILDDFRGRGLFPVLTHYIFSELKKEGLLRAYVETNSANTAAVRAFEKINVKKIATARKYCLFGRNITIWNPEGKTP